MTHKQIFDKLVRDKEGNIAVLQLPNVPLAVWIVATIVAHVVHGHLQTLSSYVALTAIVAWAILEFVSGSSLIRRILGAVVLAMVIVNRF